MPGVGQPGEWLNGGIVTNGTVSDNAVAADGHILPNPAVRDGDSRFDERPRSDSGLPRDGDVLGKSTTRSYTR